MMDEAAYKKLSLLIQKYCPDFLLEHHPMFISFLKAYYDWSMNVKEFNPWRVVSHLIEWGDIDETLDEFIDYFKSEYLNSLNVDFNGDIRKFIKHTKEFYSSRGTPESFRFLLRLLSGNTGEIFYPNQYLMKSSDGEWRQSYNIFVEFSDELDQSFVSTKLLGKYTGSTATVEIIETHYNYLTQDRFLKIYISNIKGTLDDDTIIFSNGTKDIELSAYNTVKSINITSAGNNYKPDDVLSITGDPTFICRVNKVKSGRIDSYAILNGGAGYSVGDVINVKCDLVDYYYAYPRVYVDEVDPDTGAITSLDIRYGGYGFLELPYVDSIESSSHPVDADEAEIEFISSGAGAIESVNLVSAEINYTDGTPLVITSEHGEGAVATISTGRIFTTIPYYYKPGSFLSDEFKLQDSDYWQEYSYEIRSSLTLENVILTQFSDYKDIFKKLVHPAGFKLFNSFILSNHIDLSMLYINSTISIERSPTFIDLVNWIEMVSSWNRIVDSDIIFQHRFSTILSEQNTPIGYYHRTGGEYVHSTLSSSGSNMKYAWTDLTDPAKTVWTNTLMPLVGDNLYSAKNTQSILTISSLGDNYLTDNRNIRYTRNSNGDYIPNTDYSNFFGAILTDVDQSLAEVNTWNDEWNSYSNAANLSLASSGVSYNNQNQFVAYNNADYYYDGPGWAVFYTDLSKTTVAFYARRFDTSEYKSIRGPGLYTITNRTQVYAYRPLLGETEANKKVYLLSLYTYAMYLHPANA